MLIPCSGRDFRFPVTSSEALILLAVIIFWRYNWLYVRTIHIEDIVLAISGCCLEISNKEPELFISA